MSLIHSLVSELIFESQKQAWSSVCDRDISMAWIDPAGTVIPLFGDETHWDFAERTLFQLEGRSARDGEDVVSALVRKGWVRVNNPLSLEMTSLDNLTSEQQLAILDMVRTCGKSSPFVRRQMHLHGEDPESLKVFVMEKTGNKGISMMDLARRLGGRAGEDAVFSALVNEFVSESFDFEKKLNAGLRLMVKAWISPRGSISWFKDDKSHVDFARRWVKKRGITVKYEDGDNPIRQMLKAGWMRVASLLEVKVWSSEDVSEATWAALAGAIVDVLGVPDTFLTSPEDRHVLIEEADFRSAEKVPLVEFLDRHGKPGVSDSEELFKRLMGGR